MFESQDISSGSSAKTEGSAPERAWTGAAAMALAVSAVFAGVVHDDDGAGGDDDQADRRADEQLDHREPA